MALYLKNTKGTPSTEALYAHWWEKFFKYSHLNIPIYLENGTREAHGYYENTNRKSQVAN